MKRMVTLVSALVVMFASGSTISAQDFFGQQDRAMYAGAYLSISFGAGEKSRKQPLRYGFSAGLRQQNFGISERFYGHSLPRNDEHQGYAGYGNIDARVLDFSFSNRGFEKMSFAGLSFAEKDAFGQVQFIGQGGALYANGDGEGGGGGNALLWTGLAVGLAVGIVAIARFGPGG